MTDENKIDLEFEIHSIRQDLNKVIDVLNNLDFLFKVQTKSINELLQKFDKLNQPSEIVSLPKISNQEPEVDFPEAVFPIPDYSSVKQTAVQTQVQPEPTKEEKKYIVQQKLFFDKTKSSMMAADVVFYDSKKNKVGKVKTGVNGRWRIALAPGIYTVEVSRQPMKDSPPVVPFTFQITVTESVKAIELGDKFV